MSGPTRETGNPGGATDADLFYFREDHRPLFGFHHPPQGRPTREAAVLLCQPAGHEYTRGHRAVRLLAVQLARSGFPVLRFDLHACGDSSGEDGEGDLEQWLADVSAAARECRARSGKARLAAVGLRLGGTLAALASTRGDAPDSLVLWDAVTSGREYLAELETLHHAYQRGLPGGGPPDEPGEGLERMGCRYSARLVAQLAGVDLAHLAAPRCDRVLLVETRPPDGQPAATHGLADRWKQAEPVLVSGPRIWLEREDQGLVPRPALQAIADWLGRVYA